MKYITPAMTQIFDDYYHDWTAPKDKDSYQHQHTLGSIYSQNMVDYIYKHRQDLYPLIDSLITTLKMKYMTYYDNFAHDETIFDNLQQISHKLIDEFDQPTLRTKLCAFLQLFNQDDVTRMIQLINYQIRKGIHVGDDYDEISYGTSPFIELSNKFIKRQSNHWQPSCKLNRTLNFFYEIIDQQLKPIFKNYQTVVNTKSIPQQLPNITCIDNLKPHKIDIKNYPYTPCTYNVLIKQYSQFNNQFNGDFNIYTISQILYILSLDRDILKIFNQWSQYLS